MNRVLQYDIFKIKKSKYVWISTLVALFISILVLTVTIYASKNGKYIKIGVEQYFHVLFDSISPLIFSIIVGIFVGSDFKNGTIKNIASKGITRDKIVFSKTILSFILAIIFILVHVIFGILIILTMSNQSITYSAMLILFRGLFLSILSFFAYSSIYIFIAFLVRSSGISIAISIAVNAILPTIALLIDSLIIRSERLYVSNTMPSFVSTFFKQNTIDTQQMIIYVVAMIVEIIVLYLLTDVLMKKRDIK